MELVLNGIRTERNRALKRLEYDALSHFCNSTKNAWNLARRILVLRLGLLGLRGCHVWQISPTILKIVGFPQAIVFANWSALFSEPLPITDTQDNTPLGRVSRLISSTTRRVQSKRPRDASMQRWQNAWDIGKATIFVARPSLGNKLLLRREIISDGALPVILCVFAT